MLGDGFSHVVSSPWVVPAFGLNWFNQMLGCMDPCRWPAGLILMVVHFVLVAEHKPIVGNGFHQGFVCPGGLRCLHPPDALADQVRAPGRDRARTHLSYVKLEVSLCTESPQVRFAQLWLALFLHLLSCTR